MQAQTIIPGIQGQVELMQLGYAHQAKADKESMFSQQVINIGVCLQVTPSVIDLPSLGYKRLDIRTVAEYLLQHWPGKLLAGQEVTKFQDQLRCFWSAIENLYPSHDVFSSHSRHLHQCIPAKIHSDEGTGLRKSPVYQFSWGPILASSGASWDRYFFWSCITHEAYKECHGGLKKGTKYSMSWHSILQIKQGLCLTIQLRVRVLARNSILCLSDTRAICRRRPAHTILSATLGAPKPNVPT